MLVLTRKAGEVIQIGNDITITVVEFRGGGREGLRVRIGIEAPKEVPVHRGEIYDLIAQQKLSAGEPTRGNGTMPEGDDSEEG